MVTKKAVAYFSMEIGLESTIPTYSGGLGVLAGDTLRSAADAEFSMVAITLLARQGYYRQYLSQEGWQSEEPVQWTIEDYLVQEDIQVTARVDNRNTNIGVWRYDLVGCSGHIVPVYFLDCDLSTNSDFDKSLTGQLYGGDNYYRLCQEVVLGIGGIKILRALGYNSVDRYHMNEGHSSLLVFELMAEAAKDHSNDTTLSWLDLLEKVKQQCVFTTHTPVAAGHDRFPAKMANQVLKEYDAYIACEKETNCQVELNLTQLALSASHYVNGVAKKHGEISRKMFTHYQIDSITNGVHAYTWASDSMRSLFDRVIPDWRKDNASLRYGMGIPLADIWKAHQINKRDLIEYVNKTCNIGMDKSAFTIGFARRATPYKRPTLVFSNIEKLKQIADECGKIQFIFAGKAHPQDNQGKEIIHQIMSLRGKLGDSITIAYLPDYDMKTGRLITAGTDLWLNTPQAPMEASGTSGMKAALNGVPSLSILDGWWIEGCIEGITGWSIGEENADLDTPKEADVLYSKLQNTILPLYYKDRDAYIAIMRNAIAINGSFFNTERMLSQYITKAYFR